MVESITQYRTVDGRIFNNETDANRHENIVKAIAKFVTGLPNRDNLLWNQYYQLTATEVKSCKSIFCDMLRTEYHNNKRFLAAINTYYIHNVRNRGLVGHILCDMNSPYYRVWVMFESIDDNYRMFNQPYYANNPPDNPVKIPH